LLLISRSAAGKCIFYRLVLETTAWLLKTEWVKTESVVVFYFAITFIGSQNSCTPSCFRVDIRNFKAFFQIAFDSNGKYISSCNQDFFAKV
jgi:hypothetical protein